MPLRTDEKLLALSRETIEAFDKANMVFIRGSAGACEGHQLDFTEGTYDTLTPVDSAVMVLGPGHMGSQRH
jgi:hypothetical protein